MTDNWKNNWLVIINPNAGAGKCWHDWPQIEVLLDSNGFSYQRHFTMRRLHAIVLTRHYIKEGYRKIIVVGGDGTMNEVINGILIQKSCPSSDIVVGMIPVGTGNDWGKMFDISSDYNEAVMTILASNTFVQDAGKVVYQKKNLQQQRYFVNIAGLGFDALVVKKSNRLKDRGQGNPLMYKYNIFTSLFGFKSPLATIEVDGRKVSNNVFNISVGICKYNGGGMMPLPDANPDDGLFDLTVIKKIGKFDVIRSIKKLYDGSIVRHKKVETYKGKTIRISSDSRIYLETDGESLGHTPMVFEIIPRSIRVLSARVSA
ncbi:MAG: diacylglycerol kinase family lipid kinase [Bacteroidales bacterium]|nr:diacylglycerol kinase family lipid kinase [Bacteroidales bacterium]MCB8999704.1 diacylglycerol kinase family lipid kinase [Bacteroidales bacterium]